MPIDGVQQNGTEFEAIVSWTRPRQTTDIVLYRVYFNSTDRVAPGGNTTAPRTADQLVLSHLVVGVEYELQLVVVVEGREGRELEGERSQPTLFTIPRPGQ